MATKKKSPMEELYEQIRSGNIDTSKIDFSSDEEKVKTNNDAAMEQVFEQIRSGNIDTSKIDFGNTNIDLDNKNKILTESKKEENTWFKKSAVLDDGYQFGDATKTALSSAGDVGINVVKGIAGLGEGIGDLISYGIADIQEWSGNIEKAEARRQRTQERLVDSMFQPAEDYLDKNSIFGDKSDSIAEGLGYVAGITAISIVSGGAGAALGTSSTAAATIGSTAATFTSAMGNGMTEALKDGASVDEARLYGAISGAGEAASELMFGGLGKASSAIGISKGAGELDDIIIGGLTKNIKNKMVKTITQSGLKATGEGLEEIVSGLISAAGKKLTYMDEKDFSEIAKDENLAEQFWMGVLTSAIAQGPSTINSIKGGTDYISGRTSNEQKVYDSEVNSRTEEKIRQSTIEEAYNKEIKIKENLGIEITDKVKEETKQKVENAYNNGKLKSIELNKKDLGKIEEQVQKDMEEGNISVDNIMKVLGENQDISRDKLLMRSKYENEQKYNSYVVEQSDNEKVNILMQSAVDAGMNNTNKTRKKVELISKLVQDTDRQYKFFSPEQLKEMGYNENANGLINKDTGEILINAHSNKGIQSIVGHETTHIFDSKDTKGTYTKEYQLLQDAAIEYAKAKGIYDSKVQSITNAYGDLLVDESQIKEELTADLVGDFLFNDEKFIENLAVKDRNVFQKIYDYIKHTYKMIKGTDEEKAFEELKYKFEKVYKTVSEESNSDIKYSIAGKEGMKNAIKNDTEYLELERIYNKAQQMQKAGIDNENIRQETGWFQDKNGDWKFEFSDKDMTLKNINFEEGKIYRLGNILEHNTLFVMYPELANYKVSFQKMKQGGIHNRDNNSIKINSKNIKSNLAIEGTLIHEIQHAIQKIEGFESGGSSKPSKLAYYNKLGEIEADDTKQRFLKEKNGNFNRNIVAPESSKSNPKHSKLDNYLKNRNLLEKMKDSLYTYIDNKIAREVNNEEIFEEDYKTDENEDLQNQNQDSGLVVGGRNLEKKNSKKSSFNLDKDNQGRTLTKEQQEYLKNSKVRDENGNLKVMYHGTARADRVGTLFDPNRATSGPMAFFTDNQEIAQNYSTNKSDTSLSREYDTEYDLFKVDGKDLDTYWNALSYAEKQKINKEGNNVGFDDDWENIKYGENASEDSFSDMYKWYLNNETNGNGIKALYQVWVQDGNIMDDDLYKFQEVLEKAGVKNVEFLDPYKVDSKVYEVYLNVTNPFDTSNMSEDIINQFKEASKTATIGEQYSADMWDKSNISPEDWMAKLENDLENGTAHAWTVIPDWVTNVLKANGYDGIVDTGGKNGGETHQVVIPFYSEQVKNITNENPTDNPDIRFSMTKDNYITGDDIAVKDMLKKEKTTIENEVGNTSNIKTVEDALNQTSNKKQQGMKGKAKNYISRSKTKFINDVVIKFGTSKIANTTLLNNTVEKIQNDIQDNGKLTREQIDSYFNELYDNLKKIDTAYYDEYKDVKKEIQNTKFFIPDNVKNNIADYNDFRQKNMGNIIMTNNPDNTSIDSKYKELSERYPELFPENITNISEQLQKISEVTKDISKVETNVSAYNDEYMGKEYRKWAREEFETSISILTHDIRNAIRYNEDSTPIDKVNINKEEAKNIYKLIPDAKRKYEKALAKEVLTRTDKIQVDRLLNGEIDIGELPKNSNQKGIIRLATAKAEYDSLQKSINQYVKNIKQARIEQAEKDVGDLNRWKDKKTGFRYSRETPIRNIYDIAPKEVADRITDKYFRSYIEVNEKKVVDSINGYNDRIKRLKIGTKNEYEITFENKTKKVSESALIQLLGEKKITTEDIKDSGANTTKIENAVKEFRSIYNELIEQINESMLDNGYAPVEYRKDYFPHFTEEKTDTLLGKAAKLLGIDITNREELPTDIAGQTYQFKPGRTWFSNILQRTTDVTDYDALKGFDKYVRGATDLIYHTGDIQNLRVLSSVIKGTYNNTEIQNKIEEIKESTMSDLEKSNAIQEIYDKAKDRNHLSKFIEWLDNYTNLLAGKKAINDRGAEKELNRQMYKTMQDVESRIAANAIGGNIGVSLTNFAPLAQAAGEIKTTNLINGIWQTMKSSIKGDMSFASESQFITRRRGADTLVETTINKITKPLNTVLELVDNFTSEAIVRAKYNQNLQEGMSKEVALQEADRYTAELMADRGRGALPTQFSNKNPVAKMINMFQVEVNNQWSYYLKDLPRNIQEKANNNKAKVVANTAIAYTKIMIGSYFMNELLGSIRGNSTRVLPDPIYIIKELINGLTDDDNDNDDDTVIEALTEVAGNVPFVSLPASLFADSFGLDVGDIGRIPISGAIPNVKDITSDMFDMINGEKTVGEGIKNIGGELADTVGASLILPYGGSQIKKTVKGLSLYANDLPGSYTDSGDLRYTVEEDVGSKVQAALFGAYANPYAQDYIDSGFKTIKKDNIEEMVGLDMNSTEYRNYKKGLSKAGDTSDKNGYKQYIDDNGNIYWYDTKNDVIYDSNYKKTIMDKDDLTKVTKSQEQLDYINSLDISDEKKNIMANNLNKNSKKKIDMTEYNNYDSYEEYKYARDYPQKYSVISQISSYDDYQEYDNQISIISKKYKELSDEATTSKEKTAISKQKKQEIQAYIETLPLNQYQKMMLEKEAGGYSIKNYQNYIYEYLETTNLSSSEKYTIWEELFN